MAVFLTDPITARLMLARASGAQAMRLTDPVDDTSPLAPHQGTTTSTPSRAEEIEMHLTNYLRRHGYRVWSN